MERAIDDLPQEILDLMDNLAIVVDDWPDLSTPLVSDGQHNSLYGLYEGVPLTQRGWGYSGALPDRITIFRGPLERDFGPEELKEQIQVTVVHEIAHHFGFDDDQLDELGWG